MKTKKITLLMLCFILIFSQANLISAAGLTDVGGHWAEAKIQSWASKGIIAGYEDGTYKPNSNITKAEFLTLLSKVVKPIEKESVKFTDVKSSDWFYDTVKKAVGNEYINNTDGSFKPNSNITRQEVASIICNVLQKNDEDNLSSLNRFVDKDSIAKNDKSALATMVKLGYINGYPDNTVRPTQGITRAETIVVLNNVLGTIHDKGDIQGTKKVPKIFEDNLTVTVEDIVLEHVVVKGNLYLTEGIGNGDIKLKNVTVEGETLIKGGGKNTITIEDTNLGSVIVAKKDNNIRLLVGAKSSVKKAILKSGAILKEKSSTDKGFEDVVINTGGNVELDGAFDKLVISSDAKVTAKEDTIIEKCDITEDAEDAKLELDKDSKIENLNIGARLEVKGKGKIEEAKIDKKAKGTKLDIEPEKFTIDKGTEIKVGSKTVEGTGKEETTVSKPSRRPSSGGSGRGSIPTPNYTSEINFVINDKNEHKDNIVTELINQDSESKTIVCRVPNDTERLHFTIEKDRNQEIHFSRGFFAVPEINDTETEFVSAFSISSAINGGVECFEITVKESGRKSITYKIIVAVEFNEIAAELAGNIIPFKDNKPRTTLTDYEEYMPYASNIVWEGNPSIFEVGQTYKATITITPKEGYNLDNIGENEFKIIGANDIRNEAKSGVIECTFDVVRTKQEQMDLMLNALREVTIDIKEEGYNGSLRWSISGLIHDKLNAYKLEAFRVVKTEAPTLIDSDGKLIYTSESRTEKVIVTIYNGVQGTVEVSVLIPALIPDKSIVTESIGDDHMTIKYTSGCKWLDYKLVASENPITSIEDIAEVDYESSLEEHMPPNELISNTILDLKPDTEYYITIVAVKDGEPLGLYEIKQIKTEKTAPELREGFKVVKDFIGNTVVYLVPYEPENKFVYGSDTAENMGSNIEPYLGLQIVLPHTLFLPIEDNTVISLEEDEVLIVAELDKDNKVVAVSKVDSPEEEKDEVIKIEVMPQNVSVKQGYREYIWHQLTTKSGDTEVRWEYDTEALSMDGDYVVAKADAVPGKYTLICRAKNIDSDLVGVIEVTIKEGDVVEDTTPPAFKDGYPKVNTDTISKNMFTVLMMFDENCTVYNKIVPKGDKVTKEELLAENPYEVVKDGDFSIGYVRLNPGNTYDVYIIAKDKSPAANMQTDMTIVTATTTSIVESISITPNSSEVHPGDAIVIDVDIATSNGDEMLRYTFDDTVLSFDEATSTITVKEDAESGDYEFIVQAKNIESDKKAVLNIKVVEAASVVPEFVETLGIANETYYSFRVDNVKLASKSTVYVKVLEAGGDEPSIEEIMNTPYKYKDEAPNEYKAFRIYHDIMPATSYDVYVIAVSGESISDVVKLETTTLDRIDALNANNAFIKGKKVELGDPGSNKDFYGTEKISMTITAAEASDTSLATSFEPAVEGDEVKIYKYSKEDTYYDGNDSKLYDDTQEINDGDWFTVVVNTADGDEILYVVKISVE